MFTGIISDVGEVTEITQQGERSRLMLASAYDPAFDRARRFDRDIGRVSDGRRAQRPGIPAHA